MRNISSTSSSSPSSSLSSLSSSSTSGYRTSSSPQDIVEDILNTYFKENSPEITSTPRISQKRKESPCQVISPIRKRLFLDEESEDHDTNYKDNPSKNDNEVVEDPNTKSPSGYFPRYKAINEKYVKYHKMRKNMDKINKQCFQLYKTINYYDCYIKNKVVFEDCMDKIKNQHKKLDEILELIHN